MNKTIAKPSHDKVRAMLQALTDGTIRKLKVVSPAYRAAAATLQERNPEYIKMAQHYISLESNAEEVVLDSIAHAIGSIASAAKDPDSHYSIPPSPFTQINELMYVWNFFDIAKEINADDEEIGYGYSNMSFPIFRKPGLDHVFWRGATILSLSLRDDDYRMEYGDHEGFIQWAGQHPKAGVIITMARERNIIDYETLCHLVDGENGHGSLRSGVI